MYILVTIVLFSSFFSSTLRVVISSSPKHITFNFLSLMLCCSSNASLMISSICFSWKIQSFYLNLILYSSTLLLSQNLFLILLICMFIFNHFGNPIETYCTQSVYKTIDLLDYFCTWYHDICQTLLIFITKCTIIKVRLQWRSRIS